MHPRLDSHELPVYLRRRRIIIIGRVFGLPTHVENACGHKFWHCKNRTSISASPSSSLRVNFKIMPAFYEGVISTWHVALWANMCVCVRVCLCQPVAAAACYMTYSLVSLRQSTTFHPSQKSLFACTSFGRGDTRYVYVFNSCVFFFYFHQPRLFGASKSNFQWFNLSLSLFPLHISLTSIVKCQTQLFKCSDKCSLSFFSLSFNLVVPVKVNLHANLWHIQSGTEIDRFVIAKW